MQKLNAIDLRHLANFSINQNGKGSDIDRYIYSQKGEGLGSFFGNLFRAAVPFLGKAIKGAATIAKPHIVSAGKDLIKAGAKRGFEELSKKGVEKLQKTSHRPHKRRKWRNL